MMFPKPGPKKKKMTPKPSGPSEDFIQEAVDNYCNAKGIKFIRIPNTAYSIIFGTPSIPKHVKFLVSGYLSGLPDNTILKPYKAYNLALLLELKKKNGKVGKSQTKWHKGVNVKVVYSLEEAIKAIKEFEAFE